MSECLDDRCLIEAFRAGESGAFDILFRRYKDRLYPTLLRLTGFEEDAKDLSQEAFVRAFTKLDRFHGESSFYTWIYRIAVNLALSDRRRRKLAGRVAVPLSAERPEPAEDPMLSDPTLPVERAEREQLVQQALNELHPDHRAVVTLKDFDGLRYEEIAEILGIPVGTVRSRLHRAREILRDKLRTILDMEPARATTTERA
jgi:RNA polymerase sigma-70 factor (ECF subfamily)